MNMELNEGQRHDMMYGVLYALAARNGGSIEIPMIVPNRETLAFFVDEPKRMIVVSVVPHREDIN